MTRNEVRIQKWVSIWKPHRCAHQAELRHVSLSLNGLFGVWHNQHLMFCGLNTLLSEKTWINPRKLYRVIIYFMRRYIRWCVSQMFISKYSDNSIQRLRLPAPWLLSVLFPFKGMIFSDMCIDCDWDLFCIICYIYEWKIGWIIFNQGDAVEYIYIYIYIYIYPVNATFMSTQACISWIITVWLLMQSLMRKYISL